MRLSDALQQTNCMLGLKVFIPLQINFVQLSRVASYNSESYAEVYQI
jgi:hypothetical protein